MSRLMFCGGVTGCLSALAAVAHGHPGHGASEGQTAGHYLSEPLHLLPWLAGLVLALALRGLLRSGRSAQGNPR